ncbi:MAG: hypothetical protein KKA84_00285 [Bacteroidetes bacterium]|nr:hypothetical protein [Bacteroidota bacterium]
MKKPKYKRFDYDPRFYKPEEDEDVKRRKKIRFSGSRKYNKKGNKKVIILIAFVLAIIYFYLKLNRFVP